MNAEFPAQPGEIEPARVREPRPRKRRSARSTGVAGLDAQRIAALERANEIKDNLIRTVSHEFRTSLTAIVGYAELLELGVRGQLSPVQRDDIVSIRHASAHLATLVNDLLDYSRAVGGKLTLAVTDALVIDLVRDVFSAVRPQADARAILLVDHGGDPAIRVIADPERVHQIVVNLVANAVKFSHEGDSVRLRWRAAGDDVEISVEDMGEGIPAEKLGMIFDPFVRLEGLDTVAGTGLGLTISRDLAAAMGGALDVKSTPGCGSVFTLRLRRGQSTVS
jgi:signal transduction histidine kinase